MGSTPFPAGPDAVVRLISASPKTFGRSLEPQHLLGTGFEAGCMTIVKNEPVYPFRDDDDSKPRHIIVEGSRKEIGHDLAKLATPMSDFHTFGFSTESG